MKIWDYFKYLIETLNNQTKVPMSAMRTKCEFAANAPMSALGKPFNKRSFLAIKLEGDQLSDFCRDHCHCIFYSV